MARSFTASSSQYLSKTSKPVSGFPLTLACWFKPSNNTTNSALLSFNSTTTVNNSCLIYALGAVAGDPIAAYSEGPGGGGARADTTTGFTSGEWCHCCGVFTSASSRTAYINAGSSATNTSTQNVSFSESGYVINAGAWFSDTNNAYQLFANGDIAEAAIWSVALDAAEIAALARGYSPLEIKPAAIAAYYPLGGHYGQSDVDRGKNGFNFTPVNSPTWADHPRVIYPGPVNLPIKATIIASGQPSVKRLGGVPFAHSLGRGVW